MTDSDVKLGNNSVNKVCLGSQQMLGGNPNTFRITTERSGIATVVLINTSRNHFLNMVTTENVYIHIFSDTVILPMTYMIAGNPIPVDLDSDDGVMIIISAQ